MQNPHRVNVFAYVTLLPSLPFSSFSIKCIYSGLDSPDFYAVKTERESCWYEVT